MNSTKSLVKIVNVASVPQLSPFRYPGGKTWLVPYIRAWLKSLPTRPKLFVEPFVGGGIVSLTVGFEQLATQVNMVELDEDVAAVWSTIFGKDNSWLCQRIQEFDISPEAIKTELALPVDNLRQRAFNTILKNRTFHGGILAPGSSMVKHGEGGKGVKSRWYPKTLSQRISNIWEFRDRFQFHQTDGIQFMVDKAQNSQAVFFIDPPYTAGTKGKRAGRRLYRHSQLDHNRLFEVAAALKGDFLMTYDNDQEVVELAKSHGFDWEVVPMKNTHHAEMDELLVGKNLLWARKMLHPRQERSLF